MRRHTHDRAVAITHQHIVADPHRNLLARQRVRHLQTRVLANFLFQCQLGLGGAAGFAFFDEACQTRITRRRKQSQRMLGCDRAKRHAHDGVSARGEHMHSAVLYQLTFGIANVMCECKTHTFTFANPVFLHQPHFVRPTVQRGIWVADLHMVQQLLCVIGDLEVVARNFTLLHHRAGAPAFAVDDLFVGQHGLIHRVPIHHLGLAVGDAFVEHLQKQPLVPFVITRITGRHFTRPVDGQSHGLHLLLHVGDVVVGPLGRWHAIFQSSVFRRQTKCIPTHGHEDVETFHAQMAREHVVDGVVAHMAHVQFAAGVGQHGARVVLGFGCVLGDAVDIGMFPSGLHGSLDGGCGVFGMVTAVTRCGGIGV